MSTTTIEWTDRTWNPIRGCSRVSEGCRNCYAERVAARFVKPGQPFHGFAKVVAPRDQLDRVGGRRNGWTGRVELVPSKLADPLRWRKPRRIFVNSMSDLFHESLPDEAIDSVFFAMAMAPQHQYQILTKRARRMREFMTKPMSVERLPLALAYMPASMRSRSIPTGPASWIQDGVWTLPNVWLGVSVEDQATADARIPLLMTTPAAVRFVSYEPALGPVDFDPFLHDSICPRAARGDAGSEMGPVSKSPECYCDEPREDHVDWLIVGGESGPGARPFDIGWARSTIAQCKAAGVPCFVKQLGAAPYDAHPFVVGNRWYLGAPRKSGDPSVRRLNDRKGGDSSEWPEELRVREFPAAVAP